MNVHRFLLFCALSAAVVSPASSQAPASSSAVALRPGDVIRVVVWRENDLSGDFPVDDRGRVTLPLLGEQMVTGGSVETVRDSLISLYRAQLRNPSISITPLRRISVLGEVRQPDVYLVDPTVTLAGTIALAGGITPSGDARRIRIIRDGVEIGRGAAGSSDLQQIEVRSGDQVVVGERSWAARNSQLLLSTGVSVMFFFLSVVLR